MGLIKCPECGKEISDKSEICVNCGFPIKNYLKEKGERSDYLQMENKEVDTVQKDSFMENNQYTVICELCGAENKADADYCCKCGSPIKDGGFRNNFTRVFEEFGNTDKKNSVISIIAAIFSIFGCMCYVGLILAIVDLFSGKKERQHKWSIFAILVCIVWTIVFIFFGTIGSNESDSVTDTQIESQTETETETEESQAVENTEKKSNKKLEDKEKTKSEKPKEQKKKHNKIVSAFMKDGLDEKVAVKAYNILKKKIGFKKIAYEKKADGADMYYIDADGYDVAITASDKVYRIFIPESDYVFYEDGKVKLTAKKLEDTTIDQNEGSSYYIMAQEIVKESLLNPRGAKFPSYVFNSDDVAMQKDGKLVAVQSYVDATNGYGATVRTKWTVQFVVTDIDSFSYDLKYVKVGDDSYGTFEKMN